MHSYRLTQHRTAAGERFQFDCGLPAQAMISASDKICLDGWITSACGVVRGIQLTVANRRCRDLPFVDDLKKDENGKYWYQLDLSDLADRQAGDDFAVEVAAIVADRTHPLLTLTLVRDDCTNPAVFVVGSPRSGTTIVGDSLRNTLHAQSGFGESHLLPLTGAIKSTIADFYQSSRAATNSGMMLRHVNQHLLADQMLGVIKRQYTDLFEHGCIVDKTPGGAMIRSLPDIQRLWPEARVVFVKRRGIENVVSRLKKFPEVDFESHCTQWRNCMNAWEWVRNDLPFRLELDQFDVLTQPVASAQRLAEFLNLSSPQQAILEQHFSRDKPEQTAKHLNNKTMSLDSVGWSDTQKAFFLEQCSANLERWGYSQDERYYLT